MCKIIELIWSCYWLWLGKRRTSDLARRLSKSAPTHPICFSLTVSVQTSTCSWPSPAQLMPSQPTQGLGPCSISSKRLQTAGLVWGPTFCRQARSPPTSSHKEPTVLAGRGEVRRNRHSIHKNTLGSSASQRHTEMLAAPLQISASLRDTWVSWQHCWFSLLSKTQSSLK